MDAGDAFVGSMRRRSGIDFDDVFGGPPTRSSYGSRRSGDEVVPSLSSSGREVDGGGLQTASLRTSFGDMPVFGEACSPSPRRKGLSGDFYSDIFRGGASGSSTPRRLDWDTLSSAPGSRILSPARTVVPRAEPADGFVLSPLSVTEKLEKVQGSPSVGFSTDHFLSKTEHTAALATNRMAHEKVSDPLAERDRDSHHSLHQNDLSYKNFHCKDASRDSDDSGSIGTDGNLSQDSTHSKDKKKSNQFHFSIYKWASKGVMLVVPSSPKEKIKMGGRLSGLPVPFLHGVDLPLSKKNLSSSDRIFPSEFEKQDAEACRETESTTEFSEAANRTSHTTDFSEAADQTSHTTEFSQAADRTSDQKFESMHFPNNDTIETGTPVKPQVLVSGNETNVRILSKDDSSASGLMQKQEKPTLEKLFDLIKEHKEEPDGEQLDDIEGSLHRTTSARNTDCQTETRQQAIKTTMTDHTNAESIQFEYEIPPGRVKGKVKDFMKVFTQDVSSKPMNFCEPQSRSAKAKDMENNTEIDHGKAYVNKFDWEDKSKSDSNYAVESSEPLVKRSVMDEKLKFDASAEIQQILDYFSRKNEDSISTIGRNLGNIEASNDDTDGLYFEVEECMVEQVVFHLADTDDVPQSDSNVEELQNLDARIGEWLSGKEGNIRSLLSTLQYVLWPGSGWKVVPLVDLIESSSVRRAYQRALLCLHPDKLQQRGAPAHHKYVAEKVFDVLQEAWNQFSSVSPI